VVEIFDEIFFKIMVVMRFEMWDKDITIRLGRFAVGANRAGRKGSAMVEFLELCSVERATKESRVMTVEEFADNFIRGFGKKIGARLTCVDWSAYVDVVKTSTGAARAYRRAVVAARNRYVAYDVSIIADEDAIRVCGSRFAESVEVASVAIASGDAAAAAAAVEAAAAAGDVAAGDVAAVVACVSARANVVRYENEFADAVSVAFGEYVKDARKRAEWIGWYISEAIRRFG